MGVDIISTHILIESAKDETDEDFCRAVEAMIQQTYGRRPNWLQFCAGARYVHGGTYFREFVCFAGSVSGFLQLRAERGEGLSRALIYRAENDGVARAYEIRGGTKSEFCPNELQAA